MLKRINSIRKTCYILKVTPSVFTGFLLEDLMDRLPLDQDFVRGVKQNLEAQRHGIETSFMLLDKHEDKVFSFTRARLDYIKAIKQCIEDDTFGQFIEDPDYVRQVVLNI
jgi:hypothetical protein